MTTLRGAIASAPGKLILMGEHAAVYGCPAVIAAIGLRSCVTIERVADNDETVTLDLPDIASTQVSDWRELHDYARRARLRWERFDATPTPDNFARVRGTDPAHLVKIVIGECLQYVGHHALPAASIQLRSTIPIGAGFGSSAALAVSLAAGLLASQGRAPDPEGVATIALQAERRQHGRPSGIDHHAVLLGGVARAVRDASGRLDVRPVEAGHANLRDLLGHVAVYDTGAADDATGAVVAAVKPHFTRADRSLLDRMTRTTQTFIAMLASPPPRSRDAMVNLVRDYEGSLEDIGVVPARVQATIREIECAGGAAKICGAGAIHGDSAGALLVIWPDAPPEPLPAGLRSHTPIPVALAAPGYTVETFA